jgi:hypothetical protein
VADSLQGFLGSRYTINIRFHRIDINVIYCLPTSNHKSEVQKYRWVEDYEESNSEPHNLENTPLLSYQYHNLVHSFLGRKKKKSKKASNNFPTSSKTTTSRYPSLVEEHFQTQLMLIL